MTDLPYFIHPTAVVDPSARLDEGVEMARTTNRAAGFFAYGTC